ncbi:MAG: DUF4956 domain-containing protein [Clostridia bacterium]|nr:DUF4956 domain-containing protein [Clostridia bacterium]
MFNSIYTSTLTAQSFFMMAGVALVAGLVFSWIMSFRIRSTKRFFLVTAIMPFAIATVITFVSGSIGAGIAMGGTFSLIRFRSAQGSADELAAILMAMSAGIAFGMGYLAYGVVILLGLAVIYTLISTLPIFEHGGENSERLLKVTIPESLDYVNVFDDLFDKYLVYHEPDGVKTTAMGSLFKLSFRIKMKDGSKEKQFLDELRERNGNLEVALLPYYQKQIQL